VLVSVLLLQVKATSKWPSTVNKHSRLKSSVSEKNSIYHIFKAWAAQLVSQWATGWTPGVLLPAGTTDFSLFHSIQTNCDSNPTPTQYAKSFIIGLTLHIAEHFITVY
jgi:hypothetical protein